MDVLDKSTSENDDSLARHDRGGAFSLAERSACQLDKATRMRPSAPLKSKPNCTSHLGQLGYRGQNSSLTFGASFKFALDGLSGTEHGILTGLVHCPCIASQGEHGECHVSNSARIGRSCGLNPTSPRRSSRKMTPLMVAAKQLMATTWFALSGTNSTHIAVHSCICAFLFRPMHHEWHAMTSTLQMAMSCTSLAAFNPRLAQCVGIAAT